jgi:hypothetical protein
VLGTFTVVNEREITKAMNPTVVVPTGIINDVRPDSRKAPIPIVRREVGSIIEEKFVLAKALLPMRVTALPSSTFFKAYENINAASPILVTEFGMVIEVMLELKNASGAIEVALASIVTAPVQDLPAETTPAVIV